MIDSAVNIQGTRGFSFFVQACPCLPVNLIMTADIEQNNFFLGDEERKGNPVTVLKADCMAAVKPAGQRMKRQVRLERVGLQVGNYLYEAGYEVWVLFEESARLA